MREHVMTRTRTANAVPSWSLAWPGKAAVAGMLAGAMMAMVAMVAAAAAGDGFWAPPRAITGTIFGADHAGGSFALGSVVVGMMLHMMASAGFGVVFALLLGLVTRTLAAGPQMVAGMAWGLTLWLANTLIIAPLLPGGELMTAAMPAWIWFAGHLLFGAMLGLLYAAWRRGSTELAIAAA